MISYVRKRVFFLLFVFTGLFLAGSVVRTEPALAKTRAAEAEDAGESETKDGETDLPISYQLYLGQEVVLTDVPEGEILSGGEGIVSISEEKVIRAVGVGRASVYVRRKGDTILYCNIEVRANELLDGLSFTEQSFSPGVVGAGPFSIVPDAFEGMSCQYASENVKVARVDANGMVTPVSAGQTVISVKVTDSYGGAYHFSIPVRIIEPHLARKKMNLAKGCEAVLLLEDTAGGQAVYTSSDSGVIAVKSSNAQGATLRAGKEGKAVVTAEICGLKLSCTVTVTNPKLKVQYGFYQKKKTIKLKITGINSDSVKEWTSENTAIATVSRKGTIKTRKYGSTIISCQVDGKSLAYYLAVSTKTAVKAMRYGYKRLGKKHYSQARRMSRNYFDCSSFVYRCYRAAGKYLVRRTSWAPVAADIARYYVRKGKKVKGSGTYNPAKLRPGDLICFGGSSARRNGRYKRIYHIAMYIGNGKTMESSSTYNNVVIRDRGLIKKKDVPVVVRP